MKRTRPQGSADTGAIPKIILPRDLTTGMHMKEGRFDGAGGAQALTSQSLLRSSFRQPVDYLVAG
ncbi:MAG: hypothetical protein KGJ00_19645, partial [Bradyrhizobium sp.]|nr:hypothetical protein [Bradyrhizobium sp.]